MKVLLDLFLSFFRTGLLTFGGGYSMLPMIEKEVVERYQWCNKDEMMDYFAVGQCLPGAIAVNYATFIGYRVKGYLGAIAAILGVVTPSIIIIMIIAAFLSGFMDYPVVTHAFSGIRIAVGALITNVLIGMCKKGIKDVLGIVIFLASLAIVLFTSISPIYIVLASAVAGIVSSKVKGGKQ